MIDIKMVVTDLDGTFFRKDKTISERTVSAFKKCRDKGIKAVYATGRGSSSMMVLVPSELFDGFVLMNGAIAYAGDTLIYYKLFPISKVRDLLIAANKAKIEIAVEYNGKHYANFNVTEKWPWIPQQRYEATDFSNLDIEVEKLYAIAETQRVIELIKEYLPEDLYLNISRENLAMVMHNDAVKSKGIAAFAEHLGIKQSEIVAFGDDANDIDLLQYCSIGIAVANALDEVKAVADYICDTNDNDGIAKWLEENVC